MIRKMILSDVFKIVEIEKEILNDTLGVNFLYNELSINPFANYFVKELNGEVIGYLGTRIYDNNAEFMNFVIETEYQNQGFGQELFDYVMEELEKLKVKEVSLEVRKSNTKAKRFYVKNGFVKRYIRKDYYDNEDALVYIKEV
ncbi:MAG: ribosomal protein S18-alanine N-acetyltransferase [Acholeplasma sp.]|nr:ribosomal protein S18-alanine N-acetyltransferase [Acholeplasma sp.]